MDGKEFATLRNKLGLTQKELAQLLATSLKAIHSYEQGWRSIPGNVERQLYFLLSMHQKADKHIKPCWSIKKCPPERKIHCPAWKLKAGHLCWFINGTICEGVPHKNWEEKIQICRTCEMFKKVAI
jgi:DNA-binding XRE family transcriptional regulator